MAEKKDDTRWFSSILNATDFTAASDSAFGHALALALVGRSRLTIMHVGDDDREQWQDFPQVRETLSRWGLLSPDSEAADVAEKLGIRVRKVNATVSSPTAAMLDYLADHEVDLLVLATAGRSGLPRWLKPSVAQSVARKSRIATLFLPQGTDGFVPLDDANIKLQRILVPIDDEPNASRAIEVATRWSEILSDDAAISLLHVGPAQNGQRIAERYSQRITLNSDAIINADGDVVTAIVETARRTQTDLIVMPTAGHHGVLDMLRGSTSEQVLRQAPCAVLAVPASLR